MPYDPRCHSAACAIVLASRAKTVNHAALATTIVSKCGETRMQHNLTYLTNLIHLTRQFAPTRALQSHPPVPLYFIFPANRSVYTIRDFRSKVLKRFRGSEMRGRSQIASYLRETSAHGLPRLVAPEAASRGAWAILCFLIYGSTVVIVAFLTLKYQDPHEVRGCSPTGGGICVWNLE